LNYKTEGEEIRTLIREKEKIEKGLVGGGEVSDRGWGERGFLSTQGKEELNEHGMGKGESGFQEMGKTERKRTHQ